jgi:hypothetical protein
MLQIIESHKIKMHKCNERADTDEVWNETLQWVLAQIFTLLPRSLPPAASLTRAMMSLKV